MCKSPAETQLNMVQMVALELYANFNCFPVFLGAELKERYYKGDCLCYGLHCHQARGQH